jgi:hypothetical protein
MAASYPSSVKTFTTKVNGVDDVDASHINDLQLEVTAIETDLLSGWQSFTSTMSGAAGSAGSYAEDLNYAIYCKIGKVCFVQIRKRITNKGSWSGDVLISMPIARALPNAQIGLGYIYASGAGVATAKGILQIAAGTNFKFYKTSDASVLQWSDVVNNDWVFINTMYDIA